MKTDKIWATTANTDNQLFILEADDTHPARRAMRQAKEPDPKDLPIVFHAARKKETLDDLPEFFVDAGNCVFSEAIAKPFQKFDLGVTYIVPVKVVLADQKTEVHRNRRYVTMNRFAVCNLVDLEKCRNVRPGTGPDDRWHLSHDLKDHDIVVKPSDSELPPIWGDKNLYGVRFFRGDVVAELERAGVSHFWNLKECRIAN